MDRLFSPEFKANLLVRWFGFWNVPLLYYCKPRVISIDQKRVEIKIRLRRKTKNHLKSMYFGTLAVGADIAGGVLAMQKIRESGKNIKLLFRDFHADFKLRAEGDVHFYCSDGEKIDHLVSKVLSSGKRQNELLNIVAKVPSISDDVVAVFSETISLKL
jgi:acyl-coenzyme A thioesterase PaaI-like protein